MLLTQKNLLIFFNTGVQSSNYGYVGDALFASIFKDRKK